MFPETSLDKQILILSLSSHWWEMLIHRLILLSIQVERQAARSLCESPQPQVAERTSKANFFTL